MDLGLTRRQLLAGLTGELALVGGAKAADNVVLGYGRVAGTNLHDQDLDPLVAERLVPSGRHVATVDGYRIEYRDGHVAVSEADADDEPIDAFDPATADPDRGAAVDEALGLSGSPLEELVADLGALEAGDVRFVYDGYEAFFDRLSTAATRAESDADATTRPYTVAALRGYRTAAPEPVEAVTGADPRDPLATAEGLVEGFREYTSYDVPRYLAGSVEDNVLLGAYDVRSHFESPTDFEALLEGDNDGLFCYELARRSVEALQAVPAPEQSPPVLAGFVKDERHKHVYTIVASAARGPIGDRDEGDDGGDGDLVIPVTFLDYTHSTLYDDLRVRWATGEGLDAYGTRHRATSIAWYRRG